MDNQEKQENTPAVENSQIPLPVKIIGWGNILLSLLGLFYVGAFFLSKDFHQKALDLLKERLPQETVQAGSSFMKIAIGAEIVFHLLLLVVGVGILLLKEKMRAFAIYLCVFIVVIALFSQTLPLILVWFCYQFFYLTKKDLSQIFK